MVTMYPPDGMTDGGRYRNIKGEGGKTRLNDFEKDLT